MTTEVPPAPPLLAMRGIAKSFPGVRALKGVDLTVHSGEVVALLGENGAGKSTLMNVLAGVHSDYEGVIERDGERVDIHRPKDAARHGIGMIHQELNLVPELSAAENILLGREPRTGRGTVDRKAMDRRAAELLAGLGLDTPPRRLVKDCRIAEQQLIEVAKALSLNVRVLVMDEPTSALADAEVRSLFAVIRDLTAQGVGVIYISHRLEELEAIADTVTVLRDGTHAGHRATADTTRAELIRLMVGRPLGELFPRRPEQHSDGPVRLQVDGLTHPNRSGGPSLHGIDLTVRAGEIVGLAGLMGAGRSEVLQAVFGDYGPRVRGRFTLDDKPYHPRTPGQAIRRGLALVAEDRKEQSLVLGNTVRFNGSLAALARYRTAWRTLSRRRERADVAAQVTSLKVKTPGLEATVSDLSGGNQQKVVLARCLLTEPSVLLMDEPTRGIDVGAKAEIHALMDRLAAQGTAIVAVSSELPELIGMCDRILVLCEGRLTGEFHRDPAQGPEATQEAILTAAMARETVTDEQAAVIAEHRITHTEAPDDGRRDD
ncbi:Ribose import ATP-binding protein RbsA [Streptomyces sp. YIM 130001]|uniref:sugar ABC transporter ATP-binding protein n=1 Tax=Streptomyces sp. YIM 130001 TaxID=2259644 RepID=UPI000E64D51B|nr:sugar ABC transporter ATP-binding protein [Streptomyces sp. YIM 130001]RII14743.1 Ribose import ATP-binding protein RbsA [Streptomyces sp. YIM 130001]